MTKDRESIFYLNLQKLRSGSCACGKTKKPNDSFCSPCYMKLPFTVKEDLYKEIGAGYEGAYDAAIKFLTE